MAYTPNIDTAPNAEDLKPATIDPTRPPFEQWDHDKQGCRVSINDDIASPEYLLQVDGTGLFPRGDICAIKAKAKSGKTFLSSILAAAALGCDDFQIKRYSNANDNEDTVLYFDCEQNKANTKYVVVRVHRLARLGMEHDTDRFFGLNLVPSNRDERWQRIEEMIAYCRPALVFIDGIADLITDFNDITQSTDILERLEQAKLKYNVCLACILHENKNADNKNMKGHLGTLLLQKACDVLSVERKKKGETEFFEVKQTDTRNLPVSDWHFTIEDGLPVDYTTDDEAEREQERLDTQRLVVQAFSNLGRQTLPAAALKDELKRLIPNELDECKRINSMDDGDEKKKKAANNQDARIKRIITKARRYAFVSMSRNGGKAVYTIDPNLPY